MERHHQRDRPADRRGVADPRPARHRRASATAGRSAAGAIGQTDRVQVRDDGSPASATGTPSRPAKGNPSKLSSRSCGCRAATPTRSARSVRVEDPHSGADRAPARYDTNAPVSQAINFHRGAQARTGPSTNLSTTLARQGHGLRRSASANSTCSGAHVHGSTGGFADQNVRRPRITGSTSRRPALPTQDARPRSMAAAAHMTHSDHLYGEITEAGWLQRLKG